MKKIIFFFFLFFIFSKSAFSHELDKPCSALWFQFVEDYPSEIHGTEVIVDEQLFPHPPFGSSKFCYFLGFLEISATVEPAASHIYEYYYAWLITWDLIEPDFDCPFENMLFYLVEYFDGEEFTHDQCVSDAQEEEFLSVDDVCWYINPFFANQGKKLAFYCTVKPVQSSLELSQKTLKKTNDLISESNSKLGAISGGTAAQTGFLQSIFETLNSILSQNFAISSNFFDSETYTSPSVDLVKTVELSSFQPMISSSEFSQCPSDISFSVMNSTHSISFQLVCDFAQRINPVVIAAARVAAAYIVIGAL